MCLYLSLAAVFTQNKAIQISLNQGTSLYHTEFAQIYVDPLSWDSISEAPDEQGNWQGKEGYFDGAPVSYLADLKVTCVP